ncbi:hypothetical protein CHS0354_018211 [Potamilus streckersoni]|uniref:Uncharacterized protein n=1 Tax=Potamilus streckersoni TaxID=2493646 RepID=A0AAE0RUY4_9BIVA|nr:hypothetical protein CHS0354_018211 [Potamilus streckersoni]
MGTYSTLTAFIIMMCTTPIEATGSCPTPECVTYDISTEANCTEVSFEIPTYDCRWNAGLDLNVDQVILGGRIVAYRIEWGGGGWSDWYVPGINDLDGKYNPYDQFPSCHVQFKKMGMRRTWTYFYDHNHMYIICKNP